MAEPQRQRTSRSVSAVRSRRRGLRLGGRRTLLVVSASLLIALIAVGTFFITKSKTESSVDEGTLSESALALRTEVLDLNATQGTVAALTRLRERTTEDPTLQAGARATARMIGAAAFTKNRQLADVVKNCDDSFFSACIQGGVREAVRAGVKSKDLAQACASLPNDPSVSSTLPFSCPHGVGYGLFAAYTPDFNRALGLCSDFPPEGRGYCEAGVFAANVSTLVEHGINDQDALAHEHPDGVPPGVLLKTNDLQFPCNSVIVRYQIACYDVQPWAASTLKQDPSEMYNVCAGAPAPAAPRCFFALGRLLVNPGVTADPATAAAGCVKADSKFRFQCFNGLLSQYAPRTDEMVAVCKATSGEDALACDTSFGYQLTALFPKDTARWKEECAKLVAASRDQCVRTALAQIGPPVFLTPAPPTPTR